MKDTKLEYFKKKILEHLEKQAKIENALMKKALVQAEILCKAVLPIGYVSTYKDGSQWRKIDTNKWKCIRQAKTYTTESKGAKVALGRLITKVKNATTTDELLDIVMFNIDRFRDEKGKVLDFVKELKREVENKKNYLIGKNLEKNNTQLFGFKYGKLEKTEYIEIAKKSKKAIADKNCNIDFNNFDKSVISYLKSMFADWNKNALHSPLFENYRIRFDGNSIRHFFNNGREKREVKELEKRVKCLPFVRNILEQNGEKASVYQDVITKKISFVVMGKGDIDGKETAIRIIIAKKKKDRYFYLSVQNLGEIKKEVSIFLKKVATKPSNTDTSFINSSITDSDKKSRTISENTDVFEKYNVEKDTGLSIKKLEEWYDSMNEGDRYIKTALSQIKEKGKKNTSKQVEVNRQAETQKDSSMSATSLSDENGKKSSEEIQKIQELKDQLKRNLETRYKEYDVKQKFDLLMEEFERYERFYPNASKTRRTAIIEFIKDNKDLNLEYQKNKKNKFYEKQQSNAKYQKARGKQTLYKLMSMGMIKEKFETKEEGIKYFKKIKENLKNNYDIYCVFNNQRKNLSQKNKDLQILGMEELCNYYIDYFSTLEKSLYKNPFSLWKTGSTEYVYL